MVRDARCNVRRPRREVQSARCLPEIRCVEAPTAALVSIDEAHGLHFDLLSIGNSS